jgi:hypothetical protein
MSIRNVSVLWLAVSSFSLGLFAPARSASADPITLYTASGPSYDEAMVTYNQGSSASNYTDVNSLPSAAVTTTNDGPLAATVTSNLSTSLFQFGYSLTVADPNSLAEGANQFFFTAGVDTTYSISGSLTAGGDFMSERFQAVLIDFTKNLYAYSYDTGYSISTIQTLDSSGGPLTGLLTAGDVYYYYTSDILVGNGGPGTLTGTTQISFTQPSVVPEPSSWIMLGLGSSLPFYFRSKRRRSPA